MIPGWAFVSLFRKAWNNPNKSNAFTILVWILAIIFISLIIVPIILVSLKIV